MAQGQTETTGTGTFGGSGFDAILPLAKEAWAIQMKTAQMFFDHTTKLTQTFADFYQTQAMESLKLTQTCFATGKTVAEDVRRQITTFAEKAVHQN